MAAFYIQTPGLCGIASIRSQLSHLSIEKTEDELIKLAAYKSRQIRKDGIGPRGFRNIAKAHKLGMCETSSADTEVLRDMIKNGLQPMIHINRKEDGHYILVTGVDEGHISIFDSDSQIGGHKKMSFQELDSLWPNPLLNGERWAMVIYKLDRPYKLIRRRFVAHV